MRRFKFLSVLAASIALIGLLWTVSDPQTTRTFIAKELPLVIDSFGPHAIGGATNVNYQLYLRGSFAGGPTGVFGFVVDPASTLIPAVNAIAAGVSIGPTINKAASGTHADFSSLVFDAPIIGAGAAALTNASTLKITGAPTGATNNYALWVAAGAIRIPLGGGNQEISVDAVDTAGAGFRALRVPN